MKRGAALIASTLVLGACGSSATTAPAVHAHGPAVHARVRVKSSEIDVWRDGKGRITIAPPWSPPGPNMSGTAAADEASAPGTGLMWRYDPSRRTVTQLFSTRAVASVRYLSGRDAWSAIDHELGVTKSTVVHALTSGSASPEPAGYRVPAPLTSSRNYAVYTDFGKNIARMARETRLTLPRLASLGGHPLGDATTGGWRGHNPAMFLFQNDPHSDNSVYLALDARGTGLRLSFDRARRHHRAAGTRYAIVRGEIILPYHGEWISVDDQDLGVRGGAHTYASVVRAIVTAPTVG